jgi:hypothetical protein
MTRQQAREESARLNREHPERDANSWLPRQRRDGSWDVARVSLAARSEQLAASVQPAPRPPTADDPRSAASRNAPQVGPL